MHVYVSELTIIVSDNGLSPVGRQAIIWTNVGILFIRTLGTNFGEIVRNIYTFSFKKMHLKMLSAKWQQFCLGLSVLITMLPWDELKGYKGWGWNVATCEREICQTCKCFSLFNIFERIPVPLAPVLADLSCSGSTTGSFHQQFFHHNSNVMEIWFCSHSYYELISTIILHMTWQLCCYGICKKLMRYHCQEHILIQTNFPLAWNNKFSIGLELWGKRHWLNEPLVSISLTVRVSEFIVWLKSSSLYSSDSAI